MSKTTTLAAPSKIPAVAAKQAAVANSVDSDVVKLQIESAEITKALAANPSRVDAGILNARKAAINTAIANATSEDK